MKTLPLVLAVVAFVYLDLAHTLKCRSGNVCILGDDCSEGENVCFQRKNGTGVFGMRVVRGCAASCPSPIGGEEVSCCSTDNCNNSFSRFF
uniref:Toxin 3FTx-Psa1 n=1 Tax=Psammophis mossambicus TaxID=234064 RepID=3NX1_PSAMO|nr:RecName: Full=Toxin 3FTx-Psa1; Flags: Precursor [Psammophis mossambicus]ABU68469.1 3FTx-Psa1 [Psammophis mossambicus]